ncbi:MFS transporter [Xylanimonas ulmi]|uniref:Putative MFS family arabinose efflux permease n=1 Tax=Xylanimonas ulmi TaxID=228973 RepID=A0A4Q7M2H1_9MICO|nr:MFS transporter [Xylanibacterium ulmi]RZS61027.1 putative MFS family arabinose efflux permease [Xylanibacterium ulmi]
MASATFASLRFPNYRLWFAAALVANVGAWAQRVGQDWIVLTHLTDHSGTAVGVSVAMQFLPVLALSPYAGVLADRLPRRRLLMATQSLMGLNSVVLAVLVLTGAVRLWHVFALALVGGCVSAVDNPVRATFVSELVPEASLTNAVGLNSASFNAARLVGPGVAGLLIAAVGPGWVFVITAATFALSIAAIAAMNPRALHVLPSAPRAAGQLREAVAYVRDRGDVQVIMGVVGVVTMFGLNFQLTSAMMARVEFGLGPGEFGLLGSALAVGSLAGALLTARRTQPPRVRVVLGAALAFGLAQGVSALMPSYLTYLLLAAPIGFTSLTMLTAANAALQTSVTPAMRGRVMALYMMVFLGGAPFGAPLIGWVAETFGPRVAILAGAVATLLAVAAGWTWAHRRWRVRYRLTRPATFPQLEIVHPARDLEPAA